MVQNHPKGVDNCPLNIVSSLLLLKVVASVSKYGGKLESDPKRILSFTYKTKRGSAW